MVDLKLKLLGSRCRDCSRSEEHTSELQSQSNLVCRLLLEKKKNTVLPQKVFLSPPNMDGLEPQFDEDALASPMLTPLRHHPHTFWRRLTTTLRSQPLTRLV